MALRVQPREIEIPRGNPFANDLLRRKEPIEALTALLHNVDGPFVMAVDASWGMGKTTFLKMWARHLTENDFTVVEFNAWETDFATDPFLALCSEVTDGLLRTIGIRETAEASTLRDNAGNLVRDLRGPLTRTLISSIPLIGAQAAIEAANWQESDPPPPMDEYETAKAAARTFRRIVAEAAKAARGGPNGTPLIVMVDELDRCRPTYAIELLEAAKHFFNVDHIVFILSLDRTELAHSVCAVYGQHFNADGYLRRFFDMDYRLPPVSRGDLIAAALASVGISDHLNKLARPNTADPALALKALSALLAQPAMSIRQVLQLIHRLGIILASIPDADLVSVETLYILLWLRTRNADLYRRLLAGDTTDTEIVTSLLNENEIPIATQGAERALIEGILISCVCLATSNGGAVDQHRIPRLTDYQMQAESARESGSAYDHEQSLINMIFARVSHHCTGYVQRDNSIPARAADNFGFYRSIRHIELFPESVASFRAV